MNGREVPHDVHASDGAARLVTHEPRPRRGLAPVLIVVPSLISASGLIFVLVAYLSNNQIVTDVFAVLGAILLFSDFFVTMAIFRFTVRNIDSRLSNIERLLSGGEEGDRKRR